MLFAFQSVFFMAPKVEMDLLLRIWVYLNYNCSEAGGCCVFSLQYVSVLPDIACQTLDLIGSGCVVSAPQGSLHGARHASSLTFSRSIMPPFRLFVSIEY